MTERTAGLTVPRTSSTVAVLVGVATAGLGLTLSHPQLRFGGVTAALTILGAGGFAAGFAICRRRGPIHVATGGMLLLVGYTVLLGAVLLPVATAPPIAALTAGFMAGGLLLLGLVAVGVVDPASLDVHDDLLGNWVIWFGAIALVVGGWLLVAGRVTSALNGDVLLASYRQAVAASLEIAMLFTVGHCLAVYAGVVIITWQLEHLELIDESMRSRARAVALKGLLGVSVVLILPAFLAASPTVLQAVAQQSPTAVSMLFAAGELVRSPSVALLFVGGEGLLLVGLGIAAILQAIRRIRIEYAITIVGHGMPAILLTAGLSAGFIVAISRYPGVVTTLLGPSTSGSLLPLIIVTAAVGGFALVVAIYGCLSTVRFMLGGVYNFESRGLPAAASAWLFVGGSFLGLTGTWPPLVAGALVGAILTWDLLENAVGVGEQLEGRFNAVPSEAAHMFASGAVGGLAFVLGVGTYVASSSLGAGEAPSVLVVGLLLAAAVVFALVLRRL